MSICLLDTDVWFCCHFDDEVIENINFVLLGCGRDDSR